MLKRPILSAGVEQSESLAESQLGGRAWKVAASAAASQTSRARLLKDLEKTIPIEINPAYNPNSKVRLFSYQFIINAYIYI